MELQSTSIYCEYAIIIFGALEFSKKKVRVSALKHAHPFGYIAIFTPERFQRDQIACV